MLSCCLAACEIRAYNIVCSVVLTCVMVLPTLSHCLRHHHHPCRPFCRLCSALAPLSGCRRCDTGRDRLLAAATTCRLMVHLPTWMTSEGKSTLALRDETSGCDSAPQCTVTDRRLGIAVTRWSRSPQLLYIEPG